MIAPHLDDEVLGCGGAIGYHLDCGDTVAVCFVANRVYHHVYDEDLMSIQREHALNAKEKLGYHELQFLDLPDERLDQSIQKIIISLEDYVEAFRPEIVYSPFRYDNHQDHQAVGKAAQVVFRPQNAEFVRLWIMYETPSSTEQAPNVVSPTFQPNVYYDIAPYLDRKLAALECYETEARSYPTPRSPEGIKALSMKRGMEAGLSYAEAFILVRQTIYRSSSNQFFG